MSSREYSPDNWVLIKVIKEEGTHYRVLAGFEEKLKTGDDWRISNDITVIEGDGKDYIFSCSSGSSYNCTSNSYCLSDKTNHVALTIIDQKGEEIEIMKDQKNWHEYEWSFIE